MKLDQISAFIHNLELGGNHWIGLSGTGLEDLLSLVALEGDGERFYFPEDIVKLQQMALFTSASKKIFCHIEKLKKKELQFFMEYLATLEGGAYFLSSSGSALDLIYQQFKNQMLWLDLGSEKPWQKKDRYALLLGYIAKKQGFIVDKMVPLRLLEQEEGSFEKARARLETLMLYCLNEKRITEKALQDFSPKSSTLLDFNWIDKLLYKREPLEAPECSDATSLLLFLGQLRYGVTSALKIKSLELKGYGAKQMQEFFPKTSPQALGFQLKKADEYPLSFFEQLNQLLFNKELELKRDFNQPSGLFIDLVAQITQLKELHGR